MTLDHAATANSLLLPGDPDPVLKTNPAGRSSFLLLGDHAGTCCPAALEDLGVSPADWARHIACDHGTAALGRRLAATLDARFIHQAYSRLVIDCNRAPDHPESIVETSDGTVIAGNAALTPADRAARIAQIHAPYHHAIADELRGCALPPAQRIVASLHSFTPLWNGASRPWRVGVLHGGGIEGFARLVLSLLQQELGPDAGDNQPYAMDDTDYTIPRHAIVNRHPYVELEVRQDCIATAAGIDEWAARLARVLIAARARWQTAGNPC